MRNAIAQIEMKILLCRGSAQKIVMNSWISSLKFSLFFICNWYCHCYWNSPIQFPTKSRAVIRVHGVWQYNGSLIYVLKSRSLNCNRYASLCCTGSSTIAPPWILVWLAIKMTKTVYKTRFHEFIQPSSFFGQKAWHGFISNGIMDIDCFMADIVITANDKIGNSCFESSNVNLKVIHVHELVAQTVNIGSRRRYRLITEQSSNRRARFRPSKSMCWIPVPYTHYWVLFLKR